MKRETRHGSSEPSSSNNSPRPELATVWKKPVGNVGGVTGPTISASASAMKGEAISNVDSGAAGTSPAEPSAPLSEPVSEEELLRNGIALAHRLSTAEISQRQFNWDDDDDEDQWQEQLESLVAPMIRKQHEQQQQELEKEKQEERERDRQREQDRLQRSEEHERYQRQQRQQHEQQEHQHHQHQLDQQQQNKPKALLTGATTLGGSPSSQHPSLNKGSGESSSNSTPGPALAPWSNATANLQSKVVPIGEQIKELSERKQREQQTRQQRQTSTPHYNYRLSDNQSFLSGGSSGGGGGHGYGHSGDPRYGGPSDDGRYRYHDYERRYRSDVPPPRQELYNASNGNLEPAPMRGGAGGTVGPGPIPGPGGPRIHHPNFEGGDARRRQSFDRSRSPMHNLTPPLGPPSRRRSSVDKYPGLESRRLSVGGPGIGGGHDGRGRGVSPSHGNAHGLGPGGPGHSPLAHHSPGPPPDRRLSAVSTSSSTSQTRSILEEQEEIMRQTRERARKRKEEELQKEKEREQHAKMRAEELAKKMEEKERQKKEQQEKSKPASTAATDDSNHELLAEGHVLKSLNSIINDDNESKHEKSIKGTNKLWDNRSTNGAPSTTDKVWNFSSSSSTTATTSTPTGSSENRNNLWGPVRSSSSGGSASRFSSGIYPRDSKTNGLFDDNTNFLPNQRQDKVVVAPGPSRRIMQRDQPLNQWNDNSGGGSSWRSVSAGSSIDTTTAPSSAPVGSGINKDTSFAGQQQSQSTPLSPVTTTSPFGTHDTTPNGSAREMSRFFPSSQQDANHIPDNLLLLSPKATTSNSSGHLLSSSPTYTTKTASTADDLFNGYSERGSLTNIQSPPRVVFPHLRGNGSDDVFKNALRHAPSLDSIQAVQTSIAAKLGSRMLFSSSAGGSSSASGSSSALPVPKSPVVSSLPVEDQIEIPPLLRERREVDKSNQTTTTPNISVGGLQIQSYDESIDTESSSTIPSKVKFGTLPTAATAISDKIDLDLFSKVTIPRREFSTTAYYKDSYGYTHRREFEADESATSQYTLIQLPGHGKVTISRASDNIRNYMGNRQSLYHHHPRGWSRPASASRRTVR